MTLNADDNLEHVRSKREIERKERESKINGSLPHVAEKREEAREERRNYEPEEIERNLEAERNLVLTVGLLIFATVLMGLGVFTIVRFIVEHFRG